MLAGLFVPGGETASPLVGRLPADRFFAQLTDMTALRRPASVRSDPLVR
jgi:hypothetical protein